MKWVPKGGQRKGGRPIKNWKATIEDDLNVMGGSRDNFWRHDDVAKMCCPMC